METGEYRAGYYESRTLVTWVAGVHAASAAARAAARDAAASAGFADTGIITLRRGSDGEWYTMTGSPWIHRETCPGCRSGYHGGHRSLPSESDGAHA